VTVLIGLPAILGLVCSCASDQPTAELDQLPSPGTPTAAATPKAEGSKAPPAKPKATAKPKARASGSSAKFQHFTVTVSEIERETSSEVRVLAKVCVRSLPPDPQGDRTRISWDPWSIRAGSRTLSADPSHSAFRGALPPDKTYRVGQCASGWIPFFTRADATSIKYANGVGDVAVWDANHPSRTPKLGRKAQVSGQGPATDTAEQGSVYGNCTELNVDYPHGVGLPGARDHTRSGANPVTTFKASTRLYDANVEKDRDGDGIACEKL
jgi:hypothetical protein